MSKVPLHDQDQPTLIRKIHNLELELQLSEAEANLMQIELKALRLENEQLRQQLKQLEVRTVPVQKEVNISSSQQSLVERIPQIEPHWQPSGNEVFQELPIYY